MITLFIFVFLVLVHKFGQDPLTGAKTQKPHWLLIIIIIIKNNNNLKKNLYELHHGINKEIEKNGK
jgi:hypothetical protein